MSEVQEKNLNPAGNKRAQALPLVPFNYDDEEDLTRNSVKSCSGPTRSR